MKTIKIVILLINLVATESLCAQIRIMPLGDSITYDARRIETRPIGLRTGYRQLLYLDLTAAGYDVDFVGSQIAGQDADPPFDPDNEGHPGWQADGNPVGKNIAPNVYNWLSAHPADVILLHIGTNDISSTQEPPGIASEINEILSEINRYETDNGVKIWVILARIINRLDSLASATTDLNNHIQRVADTRTGAGDNIIVVDMEKDAGLIYSIDQAAPYDGGDMYDQVHPNIDGYEKMAVKWLGDGLLAILPQADAGADQYVNEKTRVTLDGSWSIDPDAPDDESSPLDFFWAQQSGTVVTISNPAAQKPTFMAPAVGSNGERLEFKLTVADVDGFENSDSVLVDINNVLIPPVADAGPDHVIAPGITVTLNGSDSYDPDGTISSVLWEQVSGATQVSLTAPNELVTAFTTPSHAGEVLTFQLTVTDNDVLAASDIMTITVNTPEAPVADAGLDQSVTEGETVTLVGLNSHDPDGTIALVRWEQVSGNPLVGLTTPTDLTTEFTAPAVDTEETVLTFKLTIKDNDNLVGEDMVEVTVKPAAVSAASSNGGVSGGGGCFIQSVMNGFVSAHI